MPGRLLVLTGTGTEVGKTHLAEAILRAAAKELPLVVGYKPIESGVGPGVETDQARLDAASTFHVKHPRLELVAPISPHLALRREGGRMDLARWREHVTDLRERADLVVVELAGGAFTPIDEERTNADLLATWHDAVRILVGVDRLGILHDVIAVLRALAHEAVPTAIDHVVLHEPSKADPSTGTNAAELTRLTHVPTTVVPRGFSGDPTTATVVAQLLRSGRDV